MCEFMDERYLPEGQTDYKPFKMLLLPRGGFKSSAVTIGYAIQQIILNPNIRILIANENFNNSKRFASEIRGHFEGNELLKQSYGNFVGKKDWREDYFTVSKRTKNLKEPTVSCAGIDVVKVGMHYDLIICLAKDSLVMTDKGLRKIQDLTLEEKVLTHKGRWKGITALARRQSETLEVKLKASTEPTYMSPEHPVLTIGGFKKAEELKVGDLVEAPFFEKEKKEKTEDFWEMIGWWLAEGSFNGHNPWWSFHKDKDVSGIKLVKDFAKENGIGIRERLYDDFSLRIYYLSSDFNKFIKQFRIDKYKKNIPGFVFNLDKKSAVALLRGWYLGDGNKQSHGYRIASVSLELIQSARLLLAKLGYYGTIFRSKNNSGKTTIYYLMLGMAFGDLIGITKDSKTRSPYKYKIINGIIYNIVERIEKSEIKTVYNLTVEDDNTFCTPDLVTHNCDDLVSQNNVTTKEQMDKVIDFYKLALSLLEPDGEFIVIGTRWHFNDLYNHLTENEGHKFNFLTQGAIKEDGSLWFPSRLTKEFLDDQKKSQGSYIFNCQYNNSPIDDESAVFKSSWIHKFSIHQRLLIPDTNKPEDSAYRLEDCNCYMTVDPAISQKKHADYTAMVVTAVDPEQRKFVVHAKRYRVQPKKMIDEMFVLWKRYDCVQVGLEVSVFQILLKDYLMNEMRARKEYLPIVELKPVAGKKSPTRIRSLQPEFENGMVFIKPEMVDLEDELLRFPVAPFDDLSDALAYQTGMWFAPSISKKNEVPVGSFDWVRNKILKQKKDPYYIGQESNYDRLGLNDGWY